MPKDQPDTLTLAKYDCIGFDLDHCLCRYNVGPLIRLEYDLLAEYLINTKGYDCAIKSRTFDQDREFVCKGLTLDCERGNLLRLHSDGYILVAYHGSRRLGDAEIERIYGRCRKKHPCADYIHYLDEHGPAKKLVEFSPLLHSFMDYFDIAAPLMCARIVDVLDALNNHGKPMEEYYFWPDVHEGLREMYLRTNFASDIGGFFPALKANPEMYILKRPPEFRLWLQSLKDAGKYLYVITGSHYDFASFVASYAIGEDWKDLFDIIIFFARKPSFFWCDNRPFWRLDGPMEVESFEGWEDLETGEYYSQGNWKDLNEFFEYATEWQPCDTLFFGDNVIQDVLAPKKFTTTVDSVAISEEMSAEGLHDVPHVRHKHYEDLTSDLWGSYFFHPDPRIMKKTGSVVSRASSFNFAGTGGSGNVNNTLGKDLKEQREGDIKKSLSMRRVASARGLPTDEGKDVSNIERRGSDPPPSPEQQKLRSEKDPQLLRRTPKPHLPQVTSSSFDEPSSNSPAEVEWVTGPDRINTLWGCMIRDHARMCIPDLSYLFGYPIEHEFPAFGFDSGGKLTNSGFFPADPEILHKKILTAKF